MGCGVIEDACFSDPESNLKVKEILPSTDPKDQPTSAQWKGSIAFRLPGVSYQNLMINPKIFAREPSVPWVARLQLEKSDRKFDCGPSKVE
jgi:hypothetical protein